MRLILPRLAFLFLALGAVGARAAEESARVPRVVNAIAEPFIDVPEGGRLPLYISGDWSGPMPGISRAILMLHGRLRDADVYFRTALKARAAAGEAGSGALMIAPQFPAEADVEAHHAPPETLRWTWEGWEGGEPALGPSKASSFSALDAILARLADRRLFPALTDVVVAGHSGGGQIVQRYAIAGRGEAALRAVGVAVRYVVANPSTYAYFSEWRPEPEIAGACPGFNDWKYGMARRPEYLAGRTIEELERVYVSRRVTYLLGALDTNPNHPALDRSCMAEAQGPYRYARGHAYVDEMRARDRGTPNHLVRDVTGVGHDGDAMFTSSCGLAALFDLPGCG